ncbi:hypothetical protein ACW9HQ_50335, partial [Nocardia gipuzkoensis]
GESGQTGADHDHGIDGGLRGEAAIEGISDVLLSWPRHGVPSGELRIERCPPNSSDIRIVKAKQLEKRI